MEDSNLATASIVEEIYLDAGTPAVEPGPAKRATLGLSLILLAISDYRTAPENSWMFRTAKGFLFPGKVDQEYRDHFDWVLAVARGIDADWLRETLDRARPEWDAERAAGRRPSEMTEKQQQQLGDILDSGPVAYGLDNGIWTSPMIARVIEEEFGVQYHPGHVRKLLHGWGFSVQRPARVLALQRRTDGTAASIPP